MPHSYDAHDIEQHPIVVELRRALEVQRNIIGSIHGDGDARTRNDDHGPALRRTIDALVPMLVGIIIGALGSYATFSGRIATIETIVANHSVALTANSTRFDKIESKLDEIILAITQRGKQ